MQTFLPCTSFTESARCLDRSRLGKQRVECKQIFLALTVPDYGWQKHPAVRMWRDSEYALLCYGYRVCQEWVNRGYNDTLLEFFAGHLADREKGNYPSWFGDHSFHASHRSNLLRKDYVWYRQFNWPEPDNLEYVWPT